MAKIIFNDNSEIIYVNSSFNRTENALTLTFDGDSLSDIRNKFISDSNILKEITLYNDFGNMIASYIGYTEVSSMSIVNDGDGDIVLVALKQCDQTKMIELLDEKIKLQQKMLEDYGVVNAENLSDDELKKYVILQSKNTLASFLEEHPLSSTAHNNTPGLYSITNDKQNLMLQNYLIYMEEATINPDAKLTWNETGKECEVWDVLEYKQLMLEIKSLVTPLVSAQQKFEARINDLVNRDDILNANFKTEIQSTYENVISQLQQAQENKGGDN